MTKPLYFYNGTTFEQVGPTTPQSPIAYQTSAPTAPATGDIWIDSDGDVDTYNRQLTRYYYVATASQTTITGTDANGLTLAYVAGSEAVYVNGALQVRGQDYTATDGTSVVLSSALAVSDVVEIFAYTAFTVANAYTKSETDGVAAAAAGLRMVVPSSVSVGSGSGSVNAAGYVSFNGASSVSLNDVFSSTYDFYKIIVKAAHSNDGELRMRLRVSGSDNSTSNYHYQVIEASSTTIQSARYTSQSSWQLSYEEDTNYHEIMIYNPFTTEKTVGDSKVARGNTTPLFMNFTLGFGLTTSFTGLTIYPSGGNITGNIAVYGLKD